MGNPAIIAENISKQYRLGQVGTGTLRHDLNRFWYQIRGKENPYLKIGESNDRSVKGTSDYVWSLKDINFEIEQGAAVGIIGRNGAGKSTLLKLLSKVTKPTTGSFKVNGRIASLLEVGTGFHPEMTGRENIYLNGAILGMRRKEIARKFDEIVDFSGVERYIDTPVKRYSSGMYVRLAFAVAAHLESEILIVDEVLSVGDAEFQKKCLGKMNDVSKGEGRTVLFVSHNMSALQNLCGNSILLEKGNIKNSGNTEEIIKEYLNYFENSNNYEWLNINHFSTEYMEPVKIFLSDESGHQLKGSLFKNQIVYINIKINLKIKKADLTLGYSIYNEWGENLFRSLHTDADDSINNRLSPGIQTLVSKLPTDILNEGTYRLILDGGIYKKSYDFFPKGKSDISIVFTIAGGFVFSSFWSNKRKGILAPVINWEIKK